MNKINDKIIAFLTEIEPNSMEQLINISEMPFIYKWLAVMPDCHLGKGATVGSVVPTIGAIIPAAVGVDIGCGMIAVRTSFTREKLGDLSKIREGIERRIPLSAGGFNQKMFSSSERRAKELLDIQPQDMHKFGKEWEYQIGTLGSGNHFIEISLDEQDRIWAFLHSGSRGVGNKIATHYIGVAQELLNKYFIQLKDKDLAYLVEETKEFDDYIAAMNWAQRFAWLNREEMMYRVLTELSYAVYGEEGHQEEMTQEVINCHHNFTQKENHCSTCIDNLSNDSRLLGHLLADPLISKVQDFLGGCLFSRHSCGGLLLMGVNGDPISSALPNDVLERMPMKALFVHCRELLKEHSPVELSYLCACVNLAQIVGASNNDESILGQDSFRLFADGKKSDKLGKFLIGVFGNS